MTVQERFVDLLATHLAPFQPLSPEQADRLVAHYELLARWNEVINLTSIGNLEEVVLRHYCESIFLGTLLPGEGLTILDMGSGGGFPGVPLAIVFPLSRYILVESHQRKAVFLREATRAYGNVRVFAGRAEAFEGQVDWVVSRAVRPGEVARVAGRFGSRIGLLMGEGDLGDLRKVRGIQWREPVKLPWGERRIALVGEPAAG